MAQRLRKMEGFIGNTLPDIYLAIVAKFVENPTGTMFLVPPIYGERSRRALTEAGFPVRRVACMADNAYKMFAWRVGLGSKASERKDRFAIAAWILFGTGPEGCEAIPTFSDDTRGLMVVPMVVPKNVTIEIRVDKSQADEDDATIDRIRQKREALAAYAPMLRTLAQLTGKAVWFHSPDHGESATLAPITEPGDAIHMVTNMAPPGTQDVRSIRKLFGIHVANGDIVTAHGPTLGRGAVLYDGYKVPAVQIVGSTWYLLVPTLTVYKPLVSEAIFRKLLAAGWSHHAGYVESTYDPIPRGQLAKTLSAWGDDMPRMLQRLIEQDERDIVLYQEGIARKQREATIYRGVLAQLERKGGKTEIVRRALGDIAAIRKEPLVERIDAFKDGLHVHTRRIVAEEDGVRYDLGSFVIRIDFDRSVSVWTDAPTHPGGIQHPHIPKHGDPCFGNASNAIAKATGTFQYLDAIRYVIRWLAEGYQHDLASTKITEWPIVPAKEESHAK